MEIVGLKRDSSEFAVARRRMVEEQLIARGIRDPRVLDVMGRLPRHLFVERGLQDQAYGDYPVGIGEGQTISQPYIVALMTEALQLTGTEAVLEIGTGCGYQTAVLAELSRQVYTIERIKNLAFNARRTLKELAYRNVVMRVGDGTNGWPDAAPQAGSAPFDGILVAAGSPELPRPLFNQLKETGRLVIPIGNEDEQYLARVTRRNSEPVVENLGACRFVKLVGKFGWGKQREAGDRFRKRSLV
ncbi:MAG: protein-L-isoaspartate(D-aspartate) O-methyltransferase [Deltaproteobacteria bacterium]|nr:protein-L-isoaspartate(D-aspartate) O-methyltransferase [Deltaproteobacteria bacterium]